MASYKRRQSSDYNQSVPETEFIPEAHAYQEKHFQPMLNQPVSETHAETEYGSTVTPDTIESRADKIPRSTYTEQSDQLGEEDIANSQIQQDYQSNSDPGTQYSTPDVSSGVSSGSGSTLMTLVICYFLWDELPSITSLLGCGIIITSAIGLGILPKTSTPQKT